MEQWNTLFSVLRFAFFFPPVPATATASAMPRQAVCQCGAVSGRSDNSFSTFLLSLRLSLSLSLSLCFKGNYWVWEREGQEPETNEAAQRATLDLSFW